MNHYPTQTTDRLPPNTRIALSRQAITVGSVVSQVGITGATFQSFSQEGPTTESLPPVKDFPTRTRALLCYRRDSANHRDHLARVVELDAAFPKSSDAGRPPQPTVVSRLGHV